MRKKVMILMSDTGGGHRASAEALRDALSERFPGHFQVELVDLWVKHTPPPLSQVPKTYRFLVDDVPWLFRFIYEVGEKPEVLELIMEAATRVLQPFVVRALQQHKPDVIVSVHPLMQGIPLEVLEKSGSGVPFVTVVTDLITIPSVWFDSGCTLCVVPSVEGHQLALQAGLREEQIRELGLPIRPAFTRQAGPASEQRSRLGLAPDVPCVLLVSGGEGMGRLAAIARALGARLAAEGEGRPSPSGQLVVVCGRNDDLRLELEAVDWPLPVAVKGFVEDIWAWMAASDCIVTKAGPGTIAEALAIGLPIVLSGFVPGQERGNVPYVLKHGVGVYADDPWQIAEVVGGWFGPQKHVRDRLATAARALGRPEAAFDIAEEIAVLLQVPVAGRNS
jgi:1,2-diacylglycerol 3-beta-galactosyltransferase